MKSFQTLLLLAVVGLLVVSAQANPTGGTVVAGQAQIGPGANGALTITQGSNHAIINWQDFSINAGELTRFVQPDSASAVLNRVTGGNPSALLGTLEANGSVFLINPNGVLVGPNGVIQTGGSFVASTRDLTNDAFLAGGDLRFAGGTAAGVENLGFIKSGTGDVFLVGRQVRNAGTVEAAAGVAGFAAGDDVLLSSTGNDRLSVRFRIPDQPATGTGVDNAGTVKAAQAQLTAAGGNLYSLAISNGGVVEATGFAQRADGRIVLTAAGGDVAVSGQLSARNADGAGGTILVGGDYQGGNAGVPNARTTTVTASAVIKADATAASGDGGKVILWADQDTSFAGNISSRGGAAGGDGGFAEVSGKINLDFQGFADLRAPAGKDGSLLLDPTNVTLTATQIQGQLAAGSLTVTTNSAGTDAGDITITNADNGTIYVSAPNNLTLTADRDILITGFLTFQGNADTSLGTFTFNAGRDITQSGNGSLSFSLTSTGGAGTVGFTTAAGTPGAAAANLTFGGLTLDAGRDINLSKNIGITATSKGGAGGDGAYTAGTSPPNVVTGAGGTGGAGGNITLGDVKLQAGGGINFAGSSPELPNLSVLLTSAGGAGGKYYGGGNGGAGGTITAGNYTLQAGANLTFNPYADLEILASSQGGTGGVAGSYTPGPTAAGNGGTGGVGGAVTVGNISLTAGQDLDVKGNITVRATSQGGTGGLSQFGASTGDGLAGRGGAGGAATIGTVTLEATRDILSIGKSYGTLGNENAITENAVAGGAGSGGFSGGTGGPGGAAGTASVGAVTYRAGGNLTHASTTATTKLLTTSDVSFIAGNNVSLTNAAVTSTQRVTVVADNDYTTSPNYGSSTLTLSGTQLLSAASYAGASSITGTFTGGGNSLVRLFGVDAAHVTLGGFTPAATGTTNQYFGDAGATAGSLYYKAVIKPTALTITAHDFALTYGFGALPAFTAGYTGLLSGDAVTHVDFSTAAHVGSNVGTYAITPSNATLTGTGYYAISYVAGTLTINPAVLNLAGSSLSKVYGAVMPTLTATTSDLKNGDTLAAVVNLNPSTTATAGANVGSYAFSLAPTLLLPGGATQSNYSLGTVTGGTLTVTRAPLTIQADNLTRAYGAANPALTATFTGLVNGDTSAAISNFGLATTATAASAAGGYPITQTGTAAASNYTITFLPGTLTVGNPDPLGITANNFTLTYGFAALPAFTATFAGFVNGNTAADVHNLQYNTTAAVGANAGTYAITPFGATAPANYAITYTPGTLTVGKAPLSVTVNNATSVYGSALPTLGATVGGLKYSDTQAGVLNLSLSTTATAGSGANAYAITPNATLTTAGAVNYTLNPVANGTLTITPATLNVAGNNASTTYGSALPTLGATAQNLVNNDTQAGVVTFAPTTTATVGSSVGTYDILPNPALTTAGASNYVLGTISKGTLTINPALLTVSAAGATRVYGAADPAFSASATGFLAGDTAANVISFAPTTTATVSSNVGTYLIQPNPTLLSSNYAVGTTNAGLLTITPATLNLATANGTMVYNSTPTNSTTATGLVNGDRLEDVVSFVYAIEGYNPYSEYNQLYPAPYAFLENLNVGTYAISSNPRLIGATPNYRLGTVTGGQMTITPRAVTVYLSATNLARSSRSWYPDIPSFGTTVPVYDQRQFSGNTLVRTVTGSTGHADTLTFTFDGMKPSDLAAVPVSSSTTVLPTLGYRTNVQVGGNAFYSGPVITGFAINPNWTPAQNYTFAIGAPNPASLQYMASTPVTVTTGDIASVVGNPALNAIYAFNGAGLGAMNGFDLSRNQFGYRTNYTGGAQSGIYWIMPTLPTSVDPGNVAYPPTTTNTVAPLTLPVADRGSTTPGVYWYSPLSPDTEMRITTLNPGTVKVYNTAGVLDWANNHSVINQELIILNEDGSTSEAPSRGSGVGPQVLTSPGASTTHGNPRFDLSSGSLLGYPAYNAPEVFGAVELLLKAVGQPADHASVSNWLKANNSEQGKEALLPYMSQYMMDLAQKTVSPLAAQITQTVQTLLSNPLTGGQSTTPSSAPVRTPGQQLLLETVAKAVQENRIAAYEKVAAQYEQWKADQRAVKAGKKPTLYSLIDLGEAPPASLVKALGMAKNGMSEAEINATSAAIGAGVGALSTGATLGVLSVAGSGTFAVAGGTVIIPTGLAPFSGGLTLAGAAGGPLVAAAFVAVIVADSAAKVAKMEKFDRDLDALKKSAYSATSMEAILGKGTSGTAEMMNALRELNRL